MKVSDKAKKMIIHHEGLRLRPYLCPAHIWTIGVGSVLYHDQIKLPMVRKDGYTGLLRREFPLSPEHNRKWETDEVLALLESDLVRFERGVSRLSPNLVGRQYAFDAIVSFSFNVGLGAYQRSSIRQRNNRGDFEGAADAFLMWTKAAGKVLSGLVKRRNDERSLYLEDA